MTEQQSLYDILGVAPDATPEEIKAAHRAAVKRTHPDTNPGGAEAFQAVDKAYRILSDEQSRAFYDQTGRVDRKTDAHVESKSMGMLVMFLNAICNASETDFEHDLLEDVRSRIHHAVGKMDQKIFEQQKAAANLEKFKSRLTKAGSEGRDILADLLDGHAAEMRRPLEDMAFERRCLLRALDLLEVYAYTPIETRNTFFASPTSTGTGPGTFTLKFNTR